MMYHGDDADADDDDDDAADDDTHDYDHDHDGDGDAHCDNDPDDDGDGDSSCDDDVDESRAIAAWRNHIVGRPRHTQGLVVVAAVYLPAVLRLGQPLHETRWPPREAVRVHGSRRTVAGGLRPAGQRRRPLPQRGRIRGALCGTPR